MEGPYQFLEICGLISGAASGHFETIDWYAVGSRRPGGKLLVIQIGH